MRPRRGQAPPARGGCALFDEGNYRTRDGPRKRVPVGQGVAPRGGCGPSGPNISTNQVQVSSAGQLPFHSSFDVAAEKLSPFSLAVQNLVCLEQGECASYCFGRSSARFAYASQTQPSKEPLTLCRICFATTGSGSAFMMKALIAAATSLASSVAYGQIPTAPK